MGVSGDGTFGDFVSLGIRRAILGELTEEVSVRIRGVVHAKNDAVR